jgi:predicted dehydrogenase
LSLLILLQQFNGRELEDDAMVNFRMSSGIVGRLWTSSVAIGRQHGFDIQVFGEKGGLNGSQSNPINLFTQRLEIEQK